MISTIKSLLERGAPAARSLLAASKDQLRGLATRRAVQRLLARQRPIQVEVGSGGRPGRDGWVTVDRCAGCDLYWDLRRGLPFPDGSVSAIYSSHFMEHLTYREGRRFLAESLRALRPGGTFSICVPDARRVIEAYLGRGPLAERKAGGYAPAFNSTTRIDWVNYVAYMDGQHKYMFDDENLVHVLRAAGFKEVRLRAFDPRLDRPERDPDSIYAEAAR
jgi:predicted SAM-dependent methyltransferase